MRRTTARRTIATLLVGLVVGTGVAACGNDDDDTATDVTDVVVETTVAAATESTAAAGDGARVTIQNFAFDPNDFTVGAGDVITVTNEDSATHTFTSDDAGFDTTVEPATTQTVTVTADPGSYEFHCNIHPSMTGTITVE